jgi:hypothetical protein
VRNSIVELARATSLRLRLAAPARRRAAPVGAEQQERAGDEPAISAREVAAIRRRARVAPRELRELVPTSRQGARTIGWSSR